MVAPALRSRELLSMGRAVKAAREPKQGAIFSPILFALFIRFLPVPRDIKITLYADDTIILATDKNKTVLTNKLKESFHIINSPYYSRNIADLPPPPLPLETNLINWSDNVRYLGVTLDPKLKFSQHIHEIAGKARGAISNQIISPTSKIDLHTRITVFNAFILPLLTYAAPVWITAPPITHRPLYHTFYTGLRKITGSHPRTHRRTLLQLTSSKTLVDLWKSNTKSSTDTMTEHPNPLIRNLQNHISGLKPPFLATDHI
ncbi:hypothetical protein PR048_006160 [Dryococelus australis]|uniref:Reverse transcriptase domain-containing protein n=1 Tax=Dryococelus australis TaxID=614101 RepID=A0ABQ9IA81_9NEOP|nr:hypothetical protein PR048_006160 [Dryococelus australis]